MSAESEEYFGVVGRRGIAVGKVEEAPEADAPLTVPPPIPLVTPATTLPPPTRKPRMFALLEQILEKLGLLAESAKEAKPPRGVYYNSGIKTIATATEASLNQPTPPNTNYPNKERIYDTLGRTANVTVMNEGPGDIYILATSNGIVWTEYEFKIECAERIILNDAYEIALRTTLANTKYKATEYPIQTSKIKKYSSGNPYVSRATVPVAGTPITLNINAVIGTNAHSGTVANLSAVANLFVRLSSDGTTFTDNIVLYPQQALDLGDEDVHSVRLDASANNTPYQAVAH